MSLYSKFETVVLNSKNRRLNWFNRNYFYLTTILMVGLLCLCFFVLHDSLEKLVNQNVYWNVVLMALRHRDVGHLVGNLIAFIVVSLFLERHYGSFKYFGLIVLAVPLSAVSTFAFSGSWTWAGFSGVNYFMFAVFCLCLILNFKTYFIGHVRWLFSLFVLALVLFVMCWNGNFSEWPNVYFSFGCFTDLIGIISHWAPFACGTLVGLFTRLVTFDIKPKKKKYLKNKSKVYLPRRSILLKNGKVAVKVKQANKSSN